MSAIENTQADAFDFDYGKDLYESNPEEYEMKRAELISAEIAKAPEHQQRRLKGIQFELDAKRRMSDSPLESCMQMSSQMWNSFDLMRTHLNALARPDALTDEEVLQLQKQTDTAKVIPFTHVH